MPTLAEEFNAFWAVYPRRVSRQDAEKAYQRARIVATADEILAGVKAFRADLSPEDFTKERLRYLPHAATWLNKGRWTDEYDAPEPAKEAYPDCDHEPRCHNKIWCFVQRKKASGE